MSVSVINFEFDLGCFKTQRNKCCVFPFWYEGKQIYSCIKDNNIWPWCATTDNYTKDHLWDTCAGKSRTVQRPFLLSASVTTQKFLQTMPLLYERSWVTSALCTYLRLLKLALKIAYCKHYIGQVHIISLSGGKLENEMTLWCSKEAHSVAWLSLPCQCLNV